MLKHISHSFAEQKSEIIGINLLLFVFLDYISCFFIHNEIVNFIYITVLLESISYDQVAACGMDGSASH